MFIQRKNKSFLECSVFACFNTYFFKKNHIFIVIKRKFMYNLHVIVRRSIKCFIL
ncbi:predicted protein [Enterococcus faecalis Merz96]|nr:predicted protein [Enterococcus faecalis Merz96]